MLMPYLTVGWCQKSSECSVYGFSFTAVIENVFPDIINRIVLSTTNRKYNATLQC